MSEGRTSNGFGPNPITFSDMLAWSHLCDRPISAWEVGVLRRLDHATLRVLLKRSPGKGGEAEPSHEVAVGDVAGVRSILARFKG